MKTKTNKYKVPKTAQELKFFTVDEIVKDNLKSKEFRVAYEAAQARRKLVQQIRETREVKRLTQKTLAERVCMPQSVIARMERGDHNLTMETILKVANVFGKKLQLV